MNAAGGGPPGLGRGELSFMEFSIKSYVYPQFADDFFEFVTNFFWGSIIEASIN